jgi:dihydrofolate reductase
LGQTLAVLEAFIMRKLGVFENISLDGYFTDALGAMTWAHDGVPDPEFTEFTCNNAKGGGALLFGRVTYEMMAGFWTTDAAARMMPDVAKQMNALPKYVFSNTLKKADWNNTSILLGEPAAELARLKKEGGGDITILGSGTIVTQLAQARLVDSYAFVVCPVVLGRGRSLFDGVKERQLLKLETSRSFKNGKTFLSYTLA